MQVIFANAFASQTRTKQTDVVCLRFRQYTHKLLSLFAWLLFLRRQYDLSNLSNVPSIPDAVHMTPSLWFRSSAWLERSKKGVIITLTGMGLLWAVSWAVDTILRGNFGNTTAAANRCVRIVQKWRNADQSLDVEKLKTIALHYLSGSYNFFLSINFSDGVT